MKAEQVDQALRQKFVDEDQRIVFWNDENGEFADYIDVGLSAELCEINLLDLREVGGLSAKLRLEQDDPAGKYLVYSQGKMPAAEQDWLLDIRHYSAKFHADVASLWLQELGLVNLSLREHLKSRSKFLSNQERRRKLARLADPDDDEAKIDLKMMAVLAGSAVANSFDVLRALYHRHASADSFDLTQPIELIPQLEKMALADGFWKLMREEFGYSEDLPDAAGLLRRLFISELLDKSDSRFDTLAQHQLPNVGRRNAVVFLTQWRDSSTMASSYDAAAAAISEEQNVRSSLTDLDLASLKEIYTFWDAEELIVSRLRSLLLDETQVAGVEDIEDITGERKAGHWLSGSGRDASKRQAIAAAYDAIVAAAQLFALHREQRQGLNFDSPEALLKAYRTKLYRFDRLYRHFCFKAKPAAAQGGDLLKALAEKVERVYDQGFVTPLGVEWSRHLDNGVLQEWSFAEFPAQQNFYNENIQPHLDKSDRKRAFVIVSDAFRYEAAQELTELVNGRYRMNAELSTMLGVLPSYTDLGMASLLPHETLAYNEKGDVLVDGKSSSGTKARNTQLETVQGMACQANELLKKKSDEAREFTKDKKVVYIYHNVVDARGDSASTESETFEAVNDCIAELADLVQLCINKLNASKVWLTADHGFLFQQKAPGATDRSVLNDKPAQAVKMKKRYVIGPKLGSISEAHHGHISKTAQAEGEMEFWVPRADNRFHFAGGARFVHGGAMPQEVVIPLVTISHLRNEQERQASRANKVGVQVLGTSHKITTPKYRFEVIQTEAIGERRMPITLSAAIYDGIDPVSSVQTVNMDSASDNMDDRKKTLRFELKNITFDKTKPYRLVLRDTETNAEIQSVPVVIDRSFTDDF